MPALAGKGGKVVFGASGDLAEVLSWQLNEKGDQVEGTAMSPTAGPKTFTPTLTEWDGQCVCNYDPSDIDGQEILVANLETTIKLYPQGSTAGLKYWSGAIIVQNAQRQGSVDGKIQYTVSFKGNGALSRVTAP